MANKETHELLEEMKCNSDEKDQGKRSNMKETTILHDEFRFESYITGHYHYRHIWTPKIGEKLTTAHEPDNTYDEFAVSILKTNDTIVGHIPRQISKQCTALMKSAGTVKVKVNANPVNTRTQ